MEVVWSPQEDFKLGTHLGSFVDLNDEEIMIIGGYYYDTFHSSDIQVLKINKNNLKITNVPIEKPIPNRSGCGCVKYGDSVFLYSGEVMDESGIYHLSSEFYKYDINSSLFTLLPETPFEPVIEEPLTPSKSPTRKKSPNKSPPKSPVRQMKKNNKNDPLTQEISLPPPRLGSIFSILNEDQLFYFGGVNNRNNIYYNDVWIYTISLNKWELIIQSTSDEAPTIITSGIAKIKEIKGKKKIGIPLLPKGNNNNNNPKARAFPSFCNTEKGILIYGGRSKGCFLNDCFLFDKVNLEWKYITMNGSIPSNRSLCNYCNGEMIFNNNNSSMIIIGGINENGEVNSDVYILNLSTYIWMKYENNNDNNDIITFPKTLYGGNIFINSDNNIVCIGGLSGDKPNNNGYIITHKIKKSPEQEEKEREEAKRETVYSYRGGTYTGDWSDEKPNGNGILKLSDGTIYSGTFKDGEYNGSGELINPDGYSISGIFKDGYISNGRCRIKYSNGYEIREIIGNYEDNEMNGIVEIMFSNGDYYKGNYQHNQIVGYGEMRYQNGDVYKGNWMNGLYDGLGDYIYKNGNEYYTGYWKEGVRNGSGKCVYEDGSVYEGLWRNNKRNGEGIYSYHPLDCVQTEVYNGKWVGDKRNGLGTCHYANGDVYIGMWKDDIRFGRGELRYKNRSKYSGEFKYDKRHGRGTYQNLGEIINGIWKYDELKEYVKLQSSESRSTDIPIPATPLG